MGSRNDGSGESIFIKPRGFAAASGEREMVTIWGRWTLHENGTLTHEHDGSYEIDLEKCVTPAKVLDWIAQISMKKWATREDVGYLVQAMDSILRLQSNLCPGGKSKRLSPKSIMDRVAARFRNK
jgi:hypothetical protein